LILEITRLSKEKNMANKAQKIRCKAKSKRTGQQCQQWAVEGYSVCYHHGANPNNRGGAPKGSKNAMTYGAYVNELIDEGEKEIFDLFYNQLHQDFVLNKSSDEMSTQMACIYFVRLIRAIKGGNAETINKIDLLVSRKLTELKATKEKREGDTINLKTSPAEWAASLLEKVKNSNSNSGKSEK